MSTAPRSSEPRLARALAFGGVLGVLAAISNLHVSLRTGWSLPVMTTAALVGVASRGRKARDAATHAREVTLLSATASGAGYMAGGGNAAALPALVLLVGADRVPPLVAFAVTWIAIALLGTLVAPLLRRGTIDGPAPLAFPTARATVTLATTLGGSDDGEARRRTHALGGATAAAIVLAVLRGAARLPPTFGLPGRLGALTFGIDASFVLAGAGALMTLRTALSTLAGGVITYGVLVPAALEARLIPELSYRAAVSIMVWPSAALLVASSVVTLLLDLPGLVRTSSSGTARERTAVDWRALVACLGAALLSLLAMTILLHVSLRAMLVAIPIAFLLAFVAARAMGETDVVPTKALTPLAQLVFGLVDRTLVATALAPNLTSGVALHAADTLGSLGVAKATDTPRRSVLLARVFGVAVGGVAVAGAYHLVVPDASVLPTKELPVPAVLVWKSVAALSIEGIGRLPGPLKTGIAIAAILGVVLAVTERRTGRSRLAAIVPSAAGLASGMVLPASNGLAISLGALLAYAAARRAACRDLVVPIASGLVAGESLVGIISQALLHR